MKPSNVITLTTDFGLQDPYVGMIKGVILTINPQANIVDITHEIPAGSIRQGSMIIDKASRYFPSGTVHVAVVDPGVGSTRRPIAVVAADHFFVGPDNGLFWPIIQEQPHTEVIHLTESRYWLNTVSSTFHGRDIFAPVAAHLSLGVDPRVLGKQVGNPVSLSQPFLKREHNLITGEVIHVDHFGNLITNIPRELLTEFSSSEGLRIAVGELNLRGIHAAYHEVPEGEALALIGSSNLLEIALNGGSAKAELGDAYGIGTKVAVSRHQHPDQ
ncbi:MAG: SAM hydrolase/SAM-dependent halogenase family protein [Thermodesulfobacteriota bacterium]